MPKKCRDGLSVHMHRDALAEPTFLIEQDGKLYLTIALLEYDPHADDLSDEQSSGIREVWELFDRALRNAPRKAAPAGDIPYRLLSAISSPPKKDD